MHGLTEASRAKNATAVIAVDSTSLARVLRALGASAARWAETNGFRAEAGQVCLVPDAQGQARCVLVGISRADDIYALAALPQKLPPGKYRLDSAGVALDAERAALGWGLGAYRYARYRKRRELAELAVDKTTERA